MPPLFFQVFLPSLSMPSLFSRRIALLAPTALLALGGLSTSFLAHASPASDALQRLQGETWVNRSFALSDLGIGDTVLLNGFDSRQEFYLPVPRGLALAEASIDFSGRYHKAEGGSTSMLLTVNGRPVQARRIEAAEGDASQSLKVDTGVARSANFVRLGVQWSNNVARRVCELERSTGNVLAISPETRFNYRFNSGALTSLADAWATLPARPVLLVASRNLSKTSYDSAWRLGVALEQANRRVQIQAFPVAGDIVDTSGWQVPAGLAALPAFAGLASGNARYELKNEAEVGALLVLGATAASGDVLVADAALRQQIAKALEALAVQFAGDTDALRAFALWREQQTALAADAASAGQVRLATLGAHPVIVVPENAGAQAAGVFAETWRNLLVSRQAGVRTADAPDASERPAIRLNSLGASVAGFDVVSRGEWTATLPLGVVAANGRMPSELVIDVAAAPGASSTRPVASVFWNDVLLSAKRLEADGRPERLDARIPGYALGLSNVVRVSFQRQPYSNDCQEMPQGFPVNVLPTSFVRAGDAQPDGSFVGLLPLMSGNPQVAVPQAWLADAPASLARLVRMAVAAGVTPVRAELVVTQSGAFSPSKPFLALQVAVDGAASKVEVKDASLRIHGRKAPWLEVDDLSQLSAIEVSRAHGQDGMQWQPIGARPVVPAKPFVLNRGDIAMLGAEGPVSWLDSGNPADASARRGGEGAFFEWRSYAAWGMPVIGVAVFALLLLILLAWRARRRHAAKSQH
jgi:Bacterial cellulose synthase subunit